MKVLIIGGTGLLGSAAAEELISKGHQVVSVSLPPLPAGAARAAWKFGSVII